MQKAKEYFENNYGKGHIESVTEMKDFISLYALIEEYAQEQVKLFAIPDVINWVVITEELPEYGETVLTYTPLTEIASEQVRLMKYGTLNSGFPVGITHWQKIDKPPCI